MHVRTLMFTKLQNGELKPSFKSCICKGTRFFDTCNPYPLFFYILIRFLINTIAYHVQTHRFLIRMLFRKDKKMQDLNEGLSSPFYTVD